MSLGIFPLPHFLRSKTNSCPNKACISFKMSFPTPPPLPEFKNATTVYCKCEESEAK